jgi:hypothetical protein
VEWEDLLLRLEIAPRALRVAADDAAHGEPLERLLAEAVHREGLWGERLEHLREGRRLPAPDVPPEARAAASASLEAFGRERARNFARLQRRGLDVWQWRAETSSGELITAHQLIRMRLLEDAEVLRAIRALPRG